MGIRNGPPSSCVRRWLPLPPSRPWLIETLICAHQGAIMQGDVPMFSSFFLTCQTSSRSAQNHRVPNIPVWRTERAAARRTVQKNTRHAPSMIFLYISLKVCMLVELHLFTHSASGSMY